MKDSILLKVSGVSQNRIVKKLSQINISVLKIYSNNNDAFLKVYSSDYPKIKKHLKMYDISIVDYYGFLKVNDTFKKYYIIIIGFIFSLLIVIFSSQLIVDVIVVHDNPELKQIITDDLEQYGIKKFSFRKRYNQLVDIKRKIKNKHLDKIEWLEISKSGMRYIIRVEERIINPKSSSLEYCDIVAKKSGTISAINVYDGEGIVSINDYVKKDDILISGDVKLNDSVVSHNCASGDVYAEVWYQISVKIPLVYYKEKLTGKKRKNIVINYDGIDYKIFKDRLKFYQTSRKKVFDLLGIKIYLETDKELIKTVQKYTQDEALEKGKQLAKEKILLKLKNDEKIINEKILQNKLIDSTMNIDIFIITEESIGQQIEKEEGEIDDV